jgi:hypothetical protein
MEAKIVMMMMVKWSDDDGKMDNGYGKMEAKTMMIMVRWRRK